MDAKQPGKGNKLKVGDKVQIKQKEFNRMIEELASAHITPACGNCLDHRLEASSYIEIQDLLANKLKKSLPIGRVAGFGGNAYSPSGTRVLKDQYCVAVQFKTPFGAWWVYLEEKDLKKVK